MHRHIRLLSFLFVLTPALGGHPAHADQLTFQRRVEAQRAIDRIAYSHQIGARTPFDEAVPPHVSERKVRLTQRQSAELARRWRTPITAPMLKAELERILRSTRFPDRLSALFEALEYDSVLIQETLARATLAERLSRSFREGSRERTGARPEDLRGDDAGKDDDGSLEPGLMAAVAEPMALAFPAAAACGPEDLWDNGLLDDLPDPRAHPTAVWTGTEMIVWGGGEFDIINFNLPVTYDSGGRYDPLTDTWRPTSRVNAPAPRFLHTAVWTGTEMLVWGGYDDWTWTTFGDGGRYDPATDTWTPLSMMGAPEARRSHSAVWTETEMLVWGGLGDDLLQTGGLYDPATDSWRPTSVTNAPVARQNHSAVWTGSRLVVWGGREATSTTRTGGRYDPVSDTWSPTSLVNAPTARQSAPAVWSGSRMLVWGGGPTSGGRYDPATDQWSAINPAGAPPVDLGQTAVWADTGMILWGGVCAGACPGGRYDPVLDAWSVVTTAGATRRVKHAAVWTGSLMLVWGGSQLYDAEPIDTGGRYDPGTDSWTPTSRNGAPIPRSRHSAIWTGSVMIAWSGGTGGRYDPMVDSWSAVSTTGAPGGGFNRSAMWTGSRMLVWGEGTQIGGRYDPIADAWSPMSMAGAPSARFNYATTWTGTEFIIWGGSDGTTAGLNTGARYDPGGDRWTPVTTVNAPPGRATHAMVWTGSEVIVWGGQAGSGIDFAGGGRYNPATDQWQPIAITHAPVGGRSSAAIWTGSLMITGGTGPGARYDPSLDVWTPNSAAGAPASTNRSVLWTGSEMIVWGGRLNSALVQVGGRYDPALDLWQATSLVDAPSPRADHTAVWDGARMIVWGGQDQVARFASGGRYTPSPPPDADVDLDGVSRCSGDCDDARGDIWATPGEVPSLDAAPDAVTFTWMPPAVLGGVVVSYDTLRTTLAADFGAGAVCVETNDGSDTLALDGANPAVGEAFFYLVRARNDCPSGIGPAGADSNGVPHVARACP